MLGFISSDCSNHFWIHVAELAIGKVQPNLDYELPKLKIVTNFTLITNYWMTDQTFTIKKLESV